MEQQEDPAVLHAAMSKEIPRSCSMTGRPQSHPFGAVMPLASKGYVTCNIGTLSDLHIWKHC